MKALTAAEMGEVDRLTAERYRIPSLQLMENAGESVAKAVLARLLRSGNSRLRRVAVLCGKGNNGGDGFVVARHLHEKAAEVRVFLFVAPEELRGDAAINFQRWSGSNGNVTVIREDAAWEAAWPEIAGTEIIVDALLGTGLRGAAMGLVAQAIEDLNRLSQNATAARPALIVSVDTPSGLPSDGGPAAGPVLRAHLTVTFTAPKIGQLISRDAACCGQLIVRPIGSPEALIEEIGHGTVRWAGAEEFAAMPLVRTADAHKGSFGHVLLIAGSLGKTGAAILAGQAALRGGAGLVTIATPHTVLPIVAAGQPEYMTEPLTSTTSGAVSLENPENGRCAKILEGKSAIAIGPGIGTHPETQEFVRALLRRDLPPVILDADGLNAFHSCAASLRAHQGGFLALTPHPGEMARLLGVSTAEVQQDRVKTAVEAANRWNAYVVLKGFHTVLASPDGRVFINTTGNAGLAKGGSGDVLTGLLAALTGQFGTEDWLRVLALGVYLHGAAADNMDGFGDPSGLLAGAIAGEIPHARAQLLEELQGRV